MNLGDLEAGLLLDEIDLRLGLDLLWRRAVPRQRADRAIE